MQKLDETYVRLTNDVLAVNYWGELLTVELLSGLLRRELTGDMTRLVTRQMMDETRHANVTRSLLNERGRDPLRDDGVAEFTYHKLFREWAGRSIEETLTFLGTNETSSSRNFSTLVRVGLAQGDEQLVTLYSEILNDEVNHAHNIFDLLDGTPGLEEHRELADAQMKRAMNMRYLRLAAAFPDAFRLDKSKRAGGAQ